MYGNRTNQSGKHSINNFHPSCYQLGWYDMAEAEIVSFSFSLFAK